MTQHVTRPYLGMDRRRFLLISLAGALAAPATADAQTAGKAARVGFLGQTSASAQAPAVEGLRAGLRAFGYVEGDNLVIEFRWAEGNYERFPDLVAELVRLKVDVLVTGGTATIRAAKHTTTTIPIVMIGSGDAVAAGLVDSLARPGGNVTGSTFFVPELMAKRLELLKEAVPHARRVAVLVNPDDPSREPVLKVMKVTAGSLRIEIHPFEARRRDGIETAFAAMGKSRIDAIVVQEDAFLTANDPVIADLAVKKRLPSAGSRHFVEAGGHIGYGPNGPDMARRAAYFVDRILRGARPADLPVERPAKFDFIVNRKTAKTLGLTIPPSLLARADQVIE